MTNIVAAGRAADDLLVRDPLMDRYVAEALRLGPYPERLRGLCEGLAYWSHSVAAYVSERVALSQALRAVLQQVVSSTSDEQQRRDAQRRARQAIERGDTQWALGWIRAWDMRDSQLLSEEWVPRAWISAARAIA